MFEAYIRCNGSSFIVTLSCYVRHDPLPVAADLIEFIWFHG